MSIVWPELVPALIFLFVPMRVFHGPKVRHRPIMRDWEEHWPSILALSLHWIDLGRAILGAWWLADALPPDLAATGIMRFAVPLIQGAIAVLAIGVQTVACREQDCFHAPFMFVSGVLIGLYAPATAGLAIAFALTVAAGLGAPPLYFPLLGAGLLGIGYLLEGRASLAPLAVGSCAAMVPWLLPLLFRRTPVVTYRARRMLRPGTEAAVPDR